MIIKKIYSLFFIILKLLKNFSYLDKSENMYFHICVATTEPLGV